MGSISPDARDIDSAVVAVDGHGALGPLFEREMKAGPRSPGEPGQDRFAIVSFGNDPHSVGDAWKLNEE